MCVCVWQVETARWSRKGIQCGVCSSGGGVAVALAVEKDEVVPGGRIGKIIIVAVQLLLPVAFGQQVCTYVFLSVALLAAPPRTTH